MYAERQIGREESREERRQMELDQVQSCYSRLGRRWRRPRRGFRLGPTRCLIPLLRHRLCALFSLLRRWLKAVRRGVSGRNGWLQWSGRSSSRRYLVPEERRRRCGGQVDFKIISCGRSNSFSADAIAECLEFIKRSAAMAVGDEADSKQEAS